MAQFDPILGKLKSDKFNKIRFNTNYVALPKEGQLSWNATDGTLNLGMDGGDINLQLGQEQFVRVKNLSGSTILNGKCVYLDTADGGRPTAKLVNNKSSDMARKTVGICTKDIPNGEEGFITTFGKVRGLDTSSFTLGQILYVSETDGMLTGTKPIGSRWVTNVGVVTVVDPTVGEIFIRSIQYEKPDEVYSITGFPNQNSPINTISFDNSTRTFTITPTGAEFNFYQLGIQYRKLTAESVIISDTEGVCWIYYDLGVLSYVFNPTPIQSADLIENKVLIAQLYWDADNNEAILIGNERHGYTMSGDTHSYLHLTQGAKWISGMALNTVNATGNGTLDSHAQFGVDSGLGTDEDLRIFPEAVLSTAGLPIFYLSGNDLLRRKIQTGFSVLTDVTAGVGSTGRIVYNKLTAGTWSLETVTDNNYVLCHIFASNDSATTPKQPYLAFIGQNQYTIISAARTGAESEIGNIITTFPKAEMIPIATLIFNTKNTYSNAVKSRIVEVSTGVSYVDWRTTDIVAASVATPTDHNSLSGKQGGTTGEYYHITSAQNTVLANTSGTNTGDQVGDGTTITGTGTLADPFVAVGGGGGASAFTDLTDVPSSYSGQTGKQVVVKTTEDGLEFVSSVQAFDGGSFYDTYINTVNFDGGSFI